MQVTKNFLMAKIGPGAMVSLDLPISRKRLIATSLLLAHQIWCSSSKNTPTSPLFRCASSKLCGSHRLASKVGPGNSLDPPLEPAYRTHPQLSLAHQAWCAMELTMGPTFYPTILGPS
jgi:hypothetical protein